MEIDKNTKSPFRSYEPERMLTTDEKQFLAILRSIVCGAINEGIIASLPKINEPLYIDAYKIHNIIEKHGDIPLENLIITANSPTKYVTGYIEGIPYITLLLEKAESGFVLSARKFNGHYVVTFFESLDSKYLESVKKRGTLSG